MLFQNYGLFWHCDEVQWGSRGPGHEGKLLGRTSARARPVDFRNQRGVYALYDEYFEMLYVGQAGYGHRRLYDRLDQHMSDHLSVRWERFSWFGIDPVKDVNGTSKLVETDPEAPAVNIALDHLEAILIAAAEPRLNRQGARFGAAVQIFQHSDEDESDESAQIKKRLSSIEQSLAQLVAKLK